MQVWMLIDLQHESLDVHALAHLQLTINILIIRPNPMVTKQDLMRIFERTTNINELA